MDRESSRMIISYWSEMLTFGILQRFEDAGRSSLVQQEDAVSSFKTISSHMWKDETYQEKRAVHRDRPVHSMYTCPSEIDFPGVSGLLYKADQ